MNLVNKNKLLRKAKLFAIKAHNEADQYRKHESGEMEPYWRHPVRVAEMVAKYTDDPEVIAAALLHDVVEDTKYNNWDIHKEFGQRVAFLVYELTDISRPEDGNRAIRKEMDRQHIAKASAEAQTVKLADLYDNTYNIVETNPNFAPRYLKEKVLVMEVLKKGDAKLYEVVNEQLKKCLEKINA